MNIKVRKVRKFRRIERKFFGLLFIITALYAAIGILYPKIANFYHLYKNIDTKEVDSYYELLVRNAPSRGYLILDLGIKNSDNLPLAIDRLKTVMGLGEYKIWLAHHDAEKPPAYIKELGYGDMGLFISNKIHDRPEEINLLVHELGHIYVWKCLGSVFNKCNQEKLVDCSGIFLGLGILALNGLTDESRVYVSGDYETKKRFFGYLKPEQFGYLLARYCADNNIKNEIKNFLNPTGKKYFEIGQRYLVKTGYKAKTSSGPIKYIYWCGKCGFSNEIMALMNIKCEKCGGTR